MRQLITGVDADGRSCVVAEHEYGSPGDTMVTGTAFETATDPAPARPAGSGSFRDVGIAPGVARLIFVQWPPNMENAVHHTDTIDVDTLVQGSIEIVLDDGRHRLEPGDTVVVTGVDHGWAAGPQGATMSILLLGTPSP
jgi:hypothetical protein